MKSRDRSYLEWCEIMQQEPNIRDEMIFVAGRAFYVIEENAKSEESNNISHYRLLEKGEIIQDGDEAFYYGQWVKSIYAGMPVDNGIVKRAIKAQKLSFNPEWLLEKLEELRVSHYNCGGSWYSCPKSSEGCADEEAGDECNCGADRRNAVVDELIQYVHYLVELNKND